MLPKIFSFASKKKNHGREQKEKESGDPPQEDTSQMQQPLERKDAPDFLRKEIQGVLQVTT